MPIYLIRHGQSEFNAAFKRGDSDPMIFDARLTRKGVHQAKEARQYVADLGIRHVIVTPLTRALQTATYIFGEAQEMQVMAEPREKLIHSCDIGRSPAELRGDFTHLTFDHLGENWWHQGPKNDDGVSVEPDEVFQKRIAGFVSLLDQFATRPLAIVGHGNTFLEMSGHEMENCEIHQFKV